MSNSDGKTGVETDQPRLQCGLVMPISAIDGCTEEHWAEVHRIFKSSIEEIAEPRFAAQLVSEAADVGMILRRIVRNIYQCDVVVCDVSGRNPNVMFELGMRLAFDKSVVIVKDDKTDYSFDTSVIEHLHYPRDLRYERIMEFRDELKAKVRDTYLASKKHGHPGFLKNFGTFTVAKLTERAGTVEEVLLEAVKDLQREVTRLAKQGVEREKAFGLGSALRVAKDASGLGTAIENNVLRNIALEGLPELGSAVNAVTIGRIDKG